MDGVDWRSWSVADRTAVGFLLLERSNRNNPKGLHDLYELIEDHDAVAALDRAAMGQPDRVETTF